LGWKQSVSFEEGIKRTVDWYKNNDSWWQDYQKRFDLMRDKGMYSTKADDNDKGAR
jgi:dTDP-D-glucose 4,6-dehydratase